MHNKIKTILTKPIKININIHDKYSWNLLSIFGLCELVFYIFMSVDCPGCGTPFVLILFFVVYPITLIIFLIVLLVENLAKLLIKNETVVKSKKYKILRYIGLIIWFYPIFILLYVFLRILF